MKAGVVGAGGGGFPTHVKLGARAQTVIANGAECEPLLHKDETAMAHFAPQIVRGVQLCMQAVGATEGVIGVKAKKKHAVHAIEQACRGTDVRLQLLGDYYPAGDEYDLVHTVTGKLIPPGGIPIHVGAIVANVETLINVAAASENHPVTRKLLTISGAVQKPVTLSVPVGISLRECIEAAGGFATSEPVFCIGGLMMGEVSRNIDAPVTKTTTGVIVLPESHPLIQRKLTTPKQQAHIGKSACDQCRFCTELCPRYLLGYPVEPHQVMRSLSFTATGEAHWNAFAALCCSCGLCTLFSCPEQLFPKEACDNSKAQMRKAGLKYNGPSTVHAHPMHEGRRTPISLLTRKLAVTEYDVEIPFREQPLETNRVTVPLRQGAGVPNKPLVKTGDRVSKGQPLGEIPSGQLGASIHAPFAGQVTGVTEQFITLTKAS